MESFYTIIKIAPNPAMDDSLSIGILLYHSNKYYLNFSGERIIAAKKLLKERGYIVDSIKNRIIDYIGSFQNNNLRGQEFLFPIHELLKSEFITYLSKYSNGFLQFTKPVILRDSKFTDNSFDKLFSLLIDNSAEYIDPEKERKRLLFNSRIEKNVINPLAGKVHTNISIDKSKLAHMYFKIRIDCIGKNGKFISGKSLLFDKNIQVIKNDISNYIAFLNILSDEYKIPARENYYYLIADEPPPGTPEHKIYSEIRTNPFFKLVHSDESGEITEKVNDTDAKPFFEQDKLIEDEQKN